MRKTRPSSSSKKCRSVSPLMIRLDAESRAFIVQAAKLRRISVSDYVREVMVPQARREVLAAREHVVCMRPEEQLAFWNALNRVPILTDAQRRLGAAMRGET